MAMDRKARLKGDEWARIWKYETERVHREGAPQLHTLHGALAACCSADKCINVRCLHA